MAEETDKDKNRSRSDKEREERRANENAAREERRAKEQAQREERRAKEAGSRARSQGKPSKGSLNRAAAKEEAKKYDIDTKGMSTREIKGAVAEAKVIEQDMMKFIERSLDNFTAKKGDVAAPMAAPPTTTSRITEDKPSPITPVGGTPRGRGVSDIPAPPPEGTHVLGSIDGVIQWIGAAEC
jgi:hypothetical protein